MYTFPAFWLLLHLGVFKTKGLRLGSENTVVLIIRMPNVPLLRAL